MSYRITQFGSVTLPELDPEDDVSTFEARNSVVTLPDGWYDVRGGERARRNPLPLTVRRSLISEPTDIETAADVSRTEYNALRVLVGTRAKLYRTWSDEAATVEWTYARLLRIGGRADRKDNRGMAELELAFQIISPTWYDDNCLPPNRRRERGARLAIHCDQLGQRERNRRRDDLESVQHVLTNADLFPLPEHHDRTRFLMERRCNGQWYAGD